MKDLPYWAQFYFTLKNKKEHSICSDYTGGYWKTKKCIKISNEPESKCFIKILNIELVIKIIFIKH